MKKIAQTGSLLFLLAVVFYFGIAAVLSSFDLKGRRAITHIVPYLQLKGGHEPVMFNDFHPEHPYDVIVLGSSRAYRGYDPDIFQAYNLDMFNAGTSAQHPLATWTLLTELIKPQKEPLYIVDVFDFVFEGEGIESSGRIIENLPENYQAFDLMVHHPDLRNVNAFTARLLSQNTPDESPVKQYVRNGFCNTTDTLKHQLTPRVFYHFKQNDRFVEYFEKVMTELDRRNAKYVYVCAPYPTNSLRKTFHLDFLQAIQPTMQKHAAPFFDCSFSEVFTDTLDFSDDMHLNANGVPKFNRLLLTELKRKGLID
jgi:hypothetical protein